MEDEVFEKRIICDFCKKRNDYPKAYGRCLRFLLDNFKSPTEYASEILYRDTRAICSSFVEDKLEGGLK